jgi:hypothetical protein
MLILVFFLLKRCDHETNGVITQHIKKINVKSMLISSLVFQRNGMLLNVVHKMKSLQF